MKKSLGIILLLVFVSACSNSRHSSSLAGNGDSVTVLDAPDGESESASSVNGTAFKQEMQLNRKNMTDAMRVSKLSNPDFWNVDTLDRKSYVLLFNYLIDHEKNNMDDQINDFEFEYFRNSSHFIGFDKYFKQNPDDGILEALTYDIIHSWSNENENISEKDFKTNFQYLYEKGCMKYFKTIEQLDE